MTFTDFIPPKTWAFIIKMADENKLSTKEVQRIFLNKVAFDLGMTCNHERIGRARKDPEHKPYCKDCWTRLRAVKVQPYLLGGRIIKNQIRYRESDTFLSEFYRDRETEDAKAKKRDIESESESESESETQTETETTQME